MRQDAVFPRLLNTVLEDLGQQRKGKKYKYSYLQMTQENIKISPKSLRTDEHCQQSSRIQEQHPPLILPSRFDILN